MKDINILSIVVVVVYAIAAAYCFELFYGKIRQKLGLFKFVLLLILIVICLIITIVIITSIAIPEKSLFPYTG